MKQSSSPVVTFEVEPLSVDQPNLSFFNIFSRLLRTRVMVCRSQGTVAYTSYTSTLQQSTEVGVETAVPRHLRAGARSAVAETDPAGPDFGIDEIEVEVSDVPD